MDNILVDIFSYENICAICLAETLENTNSIEVSTEDLVRDGVFKYG